MGRKTYESLPSSMFSEHRIPIVLSTTIHEHQKTWNQALKYAFENCDKVFVIGGAQVYGLAFNDPACRYIYWTEILQEFPATVHLPSYLSLERNYKLIGMSDIVMEEKIPYQFLTYERKHDEVQYLNIMKQILDYKQLKKGRNGMTYVLPGGAVCRYSLRNNQVPIFTTKQTYWKKAAEELIWMIRGQTSAKALQEKKNHIWDANGTKEYLTSIGLGHREEFDLGPIYGHQWRHFGAPYTNCHADYKYQGVDQLTELLHLLRTDKNSRRILLSAWNPAQLKEMALPPCHVLCQFVVNEENELRCFMYQRSADLMLGVPFNVIFYSILTRLMAHLSGLVAVEFIHYMADVHLYEDHVAAVKEQITREPIPFPTLQFKRKDFTLEDFKTEDLLVENYRHHSPIPAKMIV